MGRGNQGLAAVNTDSAVAVGGIELLKVFFVLNVVLAVFNLIPIPPLDGSRVVGAFMSDATYARWSALDQYGMLAIFGLIVFFRNEFNELMGTAFDESTRIMVELVGG